MSRASVGARSVFGCKTHGFKRRRPKGEDVVVRIVLGPWILSKQGLGLPRLEEKVVGSIPQRMKANHPPRRQHAQYSLSVVICLLKLLRETLLRCPPLKILFLGLTALVEETLSHVLKLGRVGHDNRIVLTNTLEDDVNTLTHIATNAIVRPRQKMTIEDPSTVE